MKQESRIRWGRALLGAAALFFCADLAYAAKDDINEDGDQHEDIARVYGARRGHGPLKKYANRKVRRPGGRTVTLGLLTRQAFREQAELKRNLGRAKKGLWGGVKVTTSVTETSHAYVITQRTGAIVADPALVDRYVPRFKESHVKRRKNTLKQLSRKLQKGLDTVVRDRIKKFGKQHPLRRAYDKGGKKGLLKAMVTGKGYFGIIETIAIPKAPPRMDSQGLELPDFKRPGKKRRHRMKMKRAAQRRIAFDEPGVTVALADHPRGPFHFFQAEAPQPELFPLLGSITATGSRSRNFKLLAGNTVGHEWSKTWKKSCSLGWVQVTLSAGAGVGLRFPLRGTATLDPKNITVRAGSDRAKTFSTKLTLETMNGTSEFYSTVGLPSSQHFGAKEFVFEAHATFNIKAKALGVTLVDRTLGPSFDEGAHFKPPQGTNSAQLAEFWVPASVTGTDWSFDDYGVTAQAGAKLVGTGNPSVDVELLAANGVRKSWKKSEPNTKRSTHTVIVADPNGQRIIKGDTTSNCSADCDRSFGYRIKNPHYELANLTVTPGLKITGSLGWPFDSSISRTMWIDAGAMTLHGADLDFGPHPDTTTIIRHEDGVKKFRRQ